MTAPDHYQLYHPETQRLAFKLGTLDQATFAEMQRLPYYSAIWVKAGRGTLRTDFNLKTLGKDHLLFFSPYQPFQLLGDAQLAGEYFHFHSDFYCIFQYDKEIGCHGVLFNNIYDANDLPLEEQDVSIFENIFSMLRTEMQASGLSQHQMLTAQLRMLIIQAVRLKARQDDSFVQDLPQDQEPQLLQQLKDLIEEHFREKHAPADYADLLYITPKHLGKLTKTHFNKTPTELISERVTTEAKRDLYLTDQSVKTIAYELGFKDEYHFSRYFKKHVGVSPQGFRDSVGFDAMNRAK